MDFLDEILEPRKQPDTSGDGHWLVVGVRAKSSKEIEEREAAYLESFKHPALLDGCASWPTPFFEIDGELDGLPDKATLKQFGITPDEYRQLYERESP